jgi:serine/threonine-protein kinase
MLFAMDARMASLSSHPLPATALSAPELQRIYERTPPTPKSAERARTPLPPKVNEQSGTRPRLHGGRYEVAAYLDSGGTADIFCANDCVSGARVALKVLRSPALHDERLRRYFLYGARGAQRIQHENVVKVFDVVEVDGAPPFAVMEIVPGQPMSNLLADNTPLEPALAVALALEAASGLAAAHRMGVVHCDVKPENLLVDLDAADGAPRVRVIDFDLAAIDDEPETHDHPLLRGTARYMAPEQVLGDRVDARADVYALGVVMFRMLTGHLPFDLKLCPTLLWHQVTSKAPPPSWLCDGLDPDLEAIVLRALAKSPDNRYPTMAALIDDLRELGKGVPLLAHSPQSEPDAYLPCSDAARESFRLIARAV